MVDFWLENGPPAYVGVAAYLGLVKKRSSSSSKPLTKGETGNLDELLTMFPGGMIQ